MPRKKTRTENPVPIQMLDRLKAKHKGLSEMFKIFDECESIVSEKMPDIKYDPRCFLPSAFITELMKQFGTGIESNYNIASLFHLAAWRRYKQIYSFDADFVNVLVDSATDELIPCEALKAVPYPSFYVEINGESNIGKGIIGFFVSFDIVGQDLMLDLMAICDDHTITSTPIIINDKMTIQDSFKEIKRLCQGTDAERVSNKNIKILSDFATKAIQLVLYICAVNADIIENESQKTYKRKPSNYKLEKDIARECAKWDVGYRIGNVIRMQHSNDSDYAEREYTQNHKHTPKRPHVRRGHFHHFWKGSSLKGTKELILKWIPPQFINANLDELPAVIKEVR